MLENAHMTVRMELHNLINQQVVNYIKDINTNMQIWVRLDKAII